MEQSADEQSLSDIDTTTVSMQSLQQGQIQGQTISASSALAQNSSPPHQTIIQVQTQPALQSVVQGQPTVIQTPNSVSQHQMSQSALQNQQIQIQSVPEPANEETTATLDQDERKRREILTRRPSYRRIFNDISAGDSADVSDVKNEIIEEHQVVATDGTDISALPTTSLSYQQGTQTVTIPQTIHIPTSDGVQGLQAIQMANTSTAGTTVVQYQQQTQDGQFIYAAAPADVQVGNATTVYTLPTTQSFTIRQQIPQGVVINSPNIGHPQQQLVEDTSRKREMRLMKNREAARECRRKKKEYVKCLENRVAVLENQNKTLIEELKTLKDLYCHKSE